MDSKCVYVIYGDQARTMTREALEKLKPLAGLPRSAVVGLKPNLVVAKPSSSGATTSAGLVEGVIEHLKDHGISRIWIMESSGVGQSTSRAFKVSGLADLAVRHGAELIDLKKEPSRSMDSGSFQARVFERVRQVDYLINLPVVKAHCQTRITCALKNLKGLIPDDEKRRFHSLGLDQPIAGLNTIIRPDLIIADGLEGDLTFEEGGTPVRMDRIFLALDPVLLDSYVAANIGYGWREIGHIVLAEKLGVGTPLQKAEQVVELNRNLTPPKTFTATRSLARLTRHIDAREACSICYGGLLHALQRLDDQGGLNRLKTKIRIGQGYKDLNGDGIGIGACTADFDRSLPGCPPNPIQMVEFLNRMING